MDRTPVTNRDFRKFVNATGYVTFAETRPDARDYPGALPHMLKAGSLVFTPPKHPVDLRNWSQWWRFKFGANGDKGSLAFYNWFAYEFWRFVNVQQEVAKLAQTAIDFPPMQKGASFNLEAVKAQIEAAIKAHTGN